MKGQSLKEPSNRLIRLRLPLLTVDERLDVLLHVKWTVKEFDCNLTRELVDLIDREATKLTGATEGSLKEAAVASIPVGRIQKPEDLANMIVWLASDDADYVAGQALNCSGGLLPY